MKEYYNNTYDFSVKYPESWKYNEELCDVEVWFYNDNNDETEFKSTVNMMVIPNRNGNSLRQIMNKTKHDIKSILKNVSISEYHIFNDNEGILTYQGENNDKLLFEQRIFLKNKDIYCFTGCVSEQKKSEFYGEIKAILNSIKI
ncbi:MAG: hypothetical protein E7510_01890 [Ruminococcus sp.]|nr:hypothetical protein [Ruminococcus sp.]